MVDRNLIREFSIDDDELNSMFSAVMEAEGLEEFEAMIVDSPFFETGKILSGVVLRREGDDVLLDVGCKSEGIVPASEWDEGEPPPEPGHKVEVLLEEFDDQNGVIKLSRRKATIITQDRRGGPEQPRKMCRLLHASPGPATSRPGVRPARPARLTITAAHPRIHGVKKNRPA